MLINGSAQAFSTVPSIQSALDGAIDLLWDNNTRNHVNGNDDYEQSHVC